MRRLRPLSEAECYARCYGAGDDSVHFTRLEPRRSRSETRVSGEGLRQAFEQRLDAREPAVPEDVPIPVEGHKPAAAA